MPSKLYRICNSMGGVIVCERARIADTFLTRLVGLLGKEGLPPGDGLLITPSSGVHTWGMAFPIDIVALDERLHVVKLRADTGPWKIGGLSWSTCSVLELPAGQIARSQIVVGSVLTLAPLENDNPG